MKWLVIGISGPTNSGKTSVAMKVNGKIKGSLIIRQDDYFLPKDDPRHILIPDLNHYNWEILSSLDMERMHNDVLSIIDSQETKLPNGTSKETRLLILEGFLLYNYPPIAQLCDKKYFIDITREVCWNRRKGRQYDPPDVPGYFDRIVWPEFLRHKSEMMSDSDLLETITFLDGTEDLDKLCNKIINEVNTVLH
ncbi:hypothetical protein QAD02_024026 [Eretmocerus hayati]|uniref:Uncharacterized protein n=1 Tax=Eretmocerus hayati TaxID=131215 RepID=A0ACC2PZ84_9HYME|nr:hypothetical protein QAD02_024026 [Eretmocerus hayati]